MTSDQGTVPGHDPRRGGPAAGGGRPGPVPAVPRWLPITTIVLAVAGLAVSGYLTYEHFTASKTLACPDTGAVNCTKVTSSEQSMFLGIPVALLGLGYFVVLLALVTPP